MRLPTIVSRHRSATATAAVGMAVVATIVAVSAASGGYSAERVDLGDAAVWVANDELSSVGRANTAVHELNSIVETGGSTTRIAQRGETVLALDADRATVAVIDPTTSTVAETVAVPPASDLVLTDSRVVVVSDGAVWTMPADQLADLQVDADPDLNFGVGAAVSVAPDGSLFAFAPGTGIVQRVDVDESESVVEQWQSRMPKDATDYQITSVGGTWALLDERELMLHLSDRTVDLGGYLAQSDSPVLQEPSADGNVLAVASRAGLLTVRLDDGTVREESVPGPVGVPAAPVRHGDCLHAAWNGIAWRACSGEEPTTFPLDMDGQADLAFMSNGRSLVLNDRATGRSWAAATDYRVIDNWSELLATESEDEVVERPNADRPAPLERSQVAPKAADDTFGARPGRSSTLPVLLNDYDPNGDVLVIEALDVVPPPGVRLDLVADRQQVQVTLEDTVTDGFTFGYTVDDGRGGSATASVAVQVRLPEENGPPAQVRDRSTAVATFGRSTTAVLGDWVDPDGDPFSLVSATVSEPDAVSFTADGSVVFDERRESTGSRQVALIASDGREQGAGALEIDVRPTGAVPLIAEPFVVLATAGEEVRIDPLRHVHGGTGNVVLTSVPAKQDVLITPDYDGGTFRFESVAERTHYLEYVVTDESGAPVTGTIRVEVEAGSDRETTPITVPHTAFLRHDVPLDIDVLATDIDPTGGVLVLTELVDADAPELRIAVIDHRILRVELVAPLPLGSTTFGYRVSNGLGDAEGSVTIVEVPNPGIAQAPVANPDTASVRTGDVIDVPVLANDEHPDGSPFQLDPALDVEPTAGLLFVSGDRLRYFAPETPGEYEATYRITAEDGQSASAAVHFSVREADPETNASPVPPEVTARALAGDTVRISVALGGTDPDGDSVQLVGQESNPQRGTVLETGPDWLEYQAGDYASGTDSFTYSVVDALGARATGTVRVGIAERPDGARPPVAVEDVVEVRPGRTISVRVLDNDSDPDGGLLELTGVVSQAEAATASISGDQVDIVLPDAEGEYGFRYTVANDRLGTATAFIRVQASDDAPFARPEVGDVALNLDDVLDRERVDVDVLADAFLADADVDDLEVGLLPEFDDGAEVLRDGRIRVTVEDRSRIIPFSLTHPEDARVVSYAFIRVPGRDDAIPQLRSDAPTVSVRSGESVVLQIEDFVIAASGRPVRIADAATVRAAHGDGTDPWVDEDTLRFRSETGYFGPASISFIVTDGESANDPTARTGTIVIPIRVDPTTDQAPVFAGGAIDFEPGEAKTIELDRLVTYPGPKSDLRYRILDPLPDAFDLELDGDRLTVTPSPEAKAGTRGSATIEVTDQSGEGDPGRIDLRVVPSTRPLAQPVADRAVVQRGMTTSVDVLANDDATNPFPKTPLRVVALRGLEAVPDGVTITPDASGSTLVVEVAQDAEPVNTTLQYQVADATENPDRFAWGTVTVSVQDRPDPVSAPRVTGFGDRTLDLVFGAGAFNNSPITGYEVSLLAPGSSEVLSKVPCAATTCRVPTLGNGRADAVVLRVQARNGIGLSDPVDAPGPIWSDVVPAAPVDVGASPLDGRLGISWSPVPSGAGSPVHSYVLVVGGVPIEVDAAAVCTASRCQIESRGLENGSLVEFTVSARNEAYPAMAVWAEAGGSGTPFGPPAAGSISVVGDAVAGTVTVSWTPFSGNGDTVGGYFVQRLAEGQTSIPTGPQSCSVTSPAPGTVVPPSRGGTVVDMVGVGPDASSVQFSGATTESARYSFVVWGYNRAACASTGVGTLVVREAPGPIASVDSGMDWMTSDAWDRYISRVDPDKRLQIVAVDEQGAQIGSPRDFSGTGWLRAVLGRPFGETARFQIRTCSPWGTCGPWSAILPADAEPSLTFALPSRTWDPARAEWTWDSEPDNSGIPASFRCGIEGDDVGVAAQRPRSCEVPGARPDDRVWLDVEVAGVKVRYPNP
ncbi:Ig-like domain-containing protein [Agromyces sp. NPDC058110]|uniref:Ig-like domain-containing protein n=1 Tax=Agromyces sp. NPDC058110 TaxID=3346345 RepID=UPI0036DBDBC0